MRRTRRKQHLVQWKKTRAELKSLTFKYNKKNCEKIVTSLNCNTPTNQAWNRVRQLDSKKKANNTEVNGAQYKDSKIIANK